MTVEVEGLKELRQALRRAGPTMTRELTRAHRQTAVIAQRASQAAASSGTRQQAAAASAIRASGTQAGAALRVRNTAKAPFAQAAFWGAKKRSGWYAAARYAQSQGRQFAPWVGNDWQVARAGEGPYAINNALAANRDRILGTYADSLDRLVRELDRG